MCYFTWFLNTYRQYLEELQKSKVKELTPSMQLWIHLEGAHVLEEQYSREKWEANKGRLKKARKNVNVLRRRVEEEGVNKPYLQQLLEQQEKILDECERQTVIEPFRNLRLGMKFDELENVRACQTWAKLNKDKNNIECLKQQNGEITSHGPTMANVAQEYYEGLFGKPPQQPQEREREKTPPSTKHPQEQQQQQQQSPLTTTAAPPRPMPAEDNSTGKKQQSWRNP